MLCRQADSDSTAAGRDSRLAVPSETIHIVFSGTSVDRAYDQVRSFALSLIHQTVRFRDVTDGSSNTVLCGESLYKSTSIDHWYIGSGDNLGDDFSEFAGSTARQINTEFEASFSSQHVGGCHLLMGDAAVRFISENVNGIVLSNIGTRDGGEVNVNF